MAALEACAPCLLPIAERDPWGFDGQLIVDGEVIERRDHGLDGQIRIVHEALADGKTVTVGHTTVCSAHVTYEGVPMCLGHFAQAYDG